MEDLHFGSELEPLGLSCYTEPEVRDPITTVLEGASTIFDIPDTMPASQVVPAAMDRSPVFPPSEVSITDVNSDGAPSNDRAARQPFDFIQAPL